MLIELTDLQAAGLEDYTRLTDVALRRKLDVERGLYLAESSQVIRRALAAGHRPRSFMLARKWLETMIDAIDPETPVFVAEDAVLEAITGFHLHRGALAAMHRPALPELAPLLKDARRVAILEDIVDHTNVGALFRCAAGLGVDAVLVTPRCADPLYRRSVRVSMGAVFQVPWTRIEPWPAGLHSLRDLGFTVAAMTLRDDAIDLDQLERDVVARRGPDRLALLLGTEGNGLSTTAVDLADLAIRIPMAGKVDSLNVAAAGAVAFWATRSR